ncbi:MAG: hypothetical protein KAV00_01015 [Phycisphaerae bacterium]|nr:hypothetical protein [Phycisphaerae bacterium]
MTAIDPARLLDQHRRTAALAVEELQPSPWCAPWTPSSATGPRADRPLSLVRIVAVHEADEVGNDQGPYLEVVHQAITLPRAARSFSLVYNDWPDRWLEIYSDLDGAPATTPYTRLAAWFAANDITLAAGFSVETVVAGVEWTVTDGDIAYAVVMTGAAAESTLTATVPAVEEITYTDNGGPFDAWPNSAVMRALLSDADFNLAAFYIVDEYCWAFLTGPAWVVADAINDRKIALVKKCGGQGSYMVVQEWIRVGHALYPVGDEFQVHTHSGYDVDDYYEYDFFLAFREYDTWALEPPRARLATATLDVLTGWELSPWPAGGYIESSTWHRFKFEEGVLVSVTPCPPPA